MIYKKVKWEDLVFDFNRSFPYFMLMQRHKRAIDVDTFPCYAHDEKVLIPMIDHVEKCFPIEFEVYYGNMEFEYTGRTNAGAYCELEYDRASSKVNGLELGIVFSGKRIPPHTAHTRYLVAHEYGHIVQYYLEYKLGYKHDWNKSELFSRDYANMRGIDYVKESGGRMWHLSTDEIIANDFRICLTGVEKEFYPHECKYPLDVPEVVDFWNDMKYQWSYKNNEAV